MEVVTVGSRWTDWGIGERRTDPCSIKTCRCYYPHFSLCVGWGWEGYFRLLSTCYVAGGVFRRDKAELKKIGFWTGLWEADGVEMGDYTPEL